MTLHWRNL